MTENENSLNPSAPKGAPHQREGAPAPPSGAVAVLGALGVVFGDIGTSPLYTFKTVLGLSNNAHTPDTVIGLISLLIWTLFIITTLKYVSIAMSVDNDGEGGILALMGLLGIKKQHRPLVIFAGLFGAALIYSDGTITPAISVLSALEGVKILWPELGHLIVPLAIAILVMVFAIQPKGTEKIGKAFGPIMLAWFLVMAVLGFNALRQNLTILYAFNPLYGLKYLAENFTDAAFVLGSVFLCVTGAEALYADMSHFGAGPIRSAWSFIVWPSLMLNYFGQGAYVLNGGKVGENVFYALCPHWMLLPVIILATLATIIASQAVITGAFSMTRQGIRLGYIPPLWIKQTSAEGYGQIYIPAVNWALMAVTLTLIVIFQKSSNLTAAYGIAVATTMLMTTGLLFLAMREIFHWSLALSLIVAGFFFIVDAAFFVSNLVKIKAGGYIPLTMAAIIYMLMYVWHRGDQALDANSNKNATPVKDFLANIESNGVARVPGVGVFMTSTTEGAPPLMAWHVRKNGALQENLITVNIKVESIPWVSSKDKARLVECAPGFWRIEARFGFMEDIDVPRLLASTKGLEALMRDAEATYYVGTEFIQPRRDGYGLPRWVMSLFASMERNSTHKQELMHLPPNQIVALGRTIEI